MKTDHTFLEVKENWDYTLVPHCQYCIKACHKVQHFHILTMSVQQKSFASCTKELVIYMPSIDPSVMRK